MLAGILPNINCEEKLVMNIMLLSLQAYLQIICWQALLPSYKLNSCMRNSQVLHVHILVTGRHGVYAAEVGAEILRHRENVDFCRVFVLRTVNILGINIVLVHVTHHLSSFGLCQANTQRAERVKSSRRVKKKPTKIYNP